MLPNRALETLVRDEKYAAGAKSEGDQVVHVHKSRRDHETPDTVKQLSLSTEVQKKLLELQKKGIDINEMILEFLEKRELEIAQEKEEMVAEQEPFTLKEAEKLYHEAILYKFFENKPSSRYIPAKIKKVIQKEHGTKCSIEHCEKPAQNIHHTQTFSLGKNHDPHFLAPLCREHHVIAHSVNVKFHEKLMLVHR